MIKYSQTIHSMKFLVCALSVSSMMALTGCTTTLSHNISDNGQVAVSDLVFPDLDQAWQQDGVFPNHENLSKIRPGVNKDDLYLLLGRPHFSESQYAREWDYIFKFHQDNGEIKTCQYKVIFDRDFKAQQFYWQPAQCAKYAEIPQYSAVEPLPAVTPTVAEPIVNERINLAADALFEFDKWQVDAITSQGQKSLDELATVLRRYQDQGNSRVVITGHTDRLGDEAYNLQLSQRRAQTVADYLVRQGVYPSTIAATGEGEAKPITQCSESLERQKLIDCLQPNRRVEIGVTVYADQ